MARKLRVQFPGAIYHVTFRGNARQAIFTDDEDRGRLVRRVAESAADFGVRIYLYCWMANHGHLLVETPAGNLSAFMGSVLTGYTVYYNLRHGRSGHLMQGRFKSPLVSGDDYLLRLSRYIHLNPVQIKPWTERPLKERIRHLRQYRWSSYRGYAGLGPVEAWVCREPLLTMTPGRGGETRRYGRYVEAGLRRPDESFVKEVADATLALGAQTFCDRIMREHEGLVGRRGKREDVSLRSVRFVEPAEAVLKETCSQLGVAVEEIRRRRRDGTQRALVALALVRRSGLTQRDVASRLGLSSGSAVSHLIRQLKQRACTDAVTARLVRGITQGKQ
jgi:REP element-mobilizing transposase RayT